MSGQARGSLSRLVLDFESTFNSDPGTKAGYIIPFNTCNVASTRALNRGNTIQADRNPRAPFDGNIDAGGDVVVPVDLLNFYLWLKAILGAPTSTREASQSLDAAAAVDKGDGTVGIPCAGHGYKAGITVTIAGTTSYNGDYEIQSVTTDEFVITETYSAETFDGTETVQAKVWDHVFTPQDTLPSFLLEKRFKNPSGVLKYAQVNGLKASGLSMTVGGDGELTATVNTMGATEALSDSPYDTEGNLTTLSFTRLHNFQASLKEGGSALTGTVTTLDLQLSANLDGDTYTIGSGGARGDLPEGTMSISGTLNALFNSDALSLLEYAINAAERSLALTLLDSATGYYSLALELPEVRYGRATPPVDGPQGVRMSLPFEAFYANAALGAAIQATLKNSQQNY